ncbi:echinoidin-like isoform X1 [Pecten maximus]|uniref:echinoidin-like isoform X1 n=1 Tax=Pecten maximus TaxID=6579 RepID=UPI00145910DD|nr:echinoidin-like isoform X1 [Pecten maximus]
MQFQGEILPGNKMTLLVISALLLSVTTFCTADCPDGFSKHGGSCYKVVRIKATWAESDIYCHSAGADLATIETPEEQRFLEGHLATNAGAYDPPQFWIGGNDFAEEGTWEWLKSKTPISAQSYSNWIGATSPPINSDENCLMVTKGQHYKWEDNNCDDKYFFICEKDAYANVGIVIG